MLSEYWYILAMAVPAWRNFALVSTFHVIAVVFMHENCWKWDPNVPAMKQTGTNPAVHYTPGNRKEGKRKKGKR